MTSRTWVPRDAPITPGAELLRSDRQFEWHAYSPAHGQMMLRSRAFPNVGWPDMQGRNWPTTFDVLFAGVGALKSRISYDELAITVADAEKTAQIKGLTPSIEWSENDRVFLLESQGETDYVVASALGWHDGVLSPTQQSVFAHVNPDQPLWPWQPINYIRAGVNEASVEELVAALAADPTGRPRRERHRMAYLVMTRVDRGKDKIPDISGAGVFLTEADAEDAVTLIAPHVVDCWIEQVPIAV